MVAEGVFTTANLVSYCCAEDVVALLAAYDLSEWGDQEALTVRAAELLAPTKAAIDSSAGRDFLLHADETLVLDGPNFQKRLEILESEIVWHGTNGEFIVKKAKLVVK